MFLVDSHCHLDQLRCFKKNQDISDILKKAHLKSVYIMLSICMTISNFKKTVETLSQYKNILFSCGIHPINVNEPYTFQRLLDLSKDDRVIAIGETGLDYYQCRNNTFQQQKLFREHIRIGRELNKPIIVHMRNSKKDILSILKKEKSEECGGVLHCFTEDKETSKKLLDLGFYISFSGIITFKNTTLLNNIVRYVPLDRILIETDSPYLTPVPYRGKENQPAYVYFIAEYISKLKNITLEKFSTITTNNFYRLFHINI